MHVHMLICVRCLFQMLDNDLLSYFMKSVHFMRFLMFFTWFIQCSMILHAFVCFCNNLMMYCVFFSLFCICFNGIYNILMLSYIFFIFVMFSCFLDFLETSAVSWKSGRPPPMDSMEFDGFRFFSKGMVARCPSIIVALFFAWRKKCKTCSSEWWVANINASTAGFTFEQKT